MDGPSKAALDAVYAERNKVVCLCARMAQALGLLAFIGRHSGEDWEDDWRNIVFIELPTGQVTWHIHDSDLPMFDFLPRLPNTWDGHSTEEKYRRGIAPFGVNVFFKDYLKPLATPEALIATAPSYEEVKRLLHLECVDSWRAQYETEAP